MKIGGKFWKSDQFWLVDIPILNLMTQASTKKEIPEMVKDAIELLVDDVNFTVDVTIAHNAVFIDTNDPKKLVALILKRQRHKKNLKLEQVAMFLKAKSINEYAQYEQGKHLPSFEKFEQLLKAIDPELMPFVDAYSV